MNRRIFASHPVVCLFATVLMMSLMSGRAQAQTVGSDGAVGVNANWEAGQAPEWFIDEQKYGLILIQDGITVENDAQIREGLLVLDWSFAHEAADGSFPGTAGGEIPTMFHCTSVFIEAAARSTIMLQQYHPVSYTPDSAYYAGKIASYKTYLHATGAWLMEPAIAAAGQNNDKPYTHRRYLLAAALAEIGTLTGDSSMIAAATPYVQNGLALQMTSGTEQVPYPDGTIHTVSMIGVNPELGGYDVSYQCVSIFYASVYFPYCTDSGLKSQLNTMMERGLNWEVGRVDLYGDIDVTGSTRMGIDRTHDGVIKTPDLYSVTGALNNGTTITADARFQIVATRIRQGKETVSTVTLGSDGAAGANVAWEAGTAATWSIATQKLGADYVAAGIRLDNNFLIKRGMRIIDWGFAHQGSDGSFPGTTTAFYSTGLFVEAAARAALQLKSYNPVLDHAAMGTYTATLQSWTGRLRNAAAWLTRSDIAPAGLKSIAPYTSRFYTLAAALGETGALTGSASDGTAAEPYIDTALSMQTANGVNPENGVADPNLQALGLLEASYYYAYCGDAKRQARLETMLEAGLSWESGWVNSQGVVTGVSSPNLAWISDAFAQGYAITGDPLYEVIVCRMSGLYR